MTRAIALATGAIYRDVYQQIASMLGSSPREGVIDRIIEDYLSNAGWKRQALDAAHDDHGLLVEEMDFPNGIVIVSCRKPDRLNGHLFTICDGTLHDTWDPRDEGAYVVEAYWTPTATARVNTTFSEPRKHATDLTQEQFEKILGRLKAIDNTAKNHASTDSERENALRMMQSLMLRHNLTREDIAGKDELDTMQFTRLACPLNGSRSCAWENGLANYVTEVIFPMSQWYVARRGHRTLYFFYGPRADVENAVGLFRELLITIATAARRLYGGYARGSGVSYAEGYVASLPRDVPHEKSSPTSGESQSTANKSLVQLRSLSVHQASAEWLSAECDVQLSRGSRSGRYRHDPSAAEMGKIHGAQHKIDIPSAPKRLGHSG